MHLRNSEHSEKRQKFRKCQTTKNSFLDQNSFWIKTHVLSKFIWIQTPLNQNSFWIKTNFESKLIWIKTHYWIKMYFGSKFNLDQNSFWIKNDPESYCSVKTWIKIRPASNSVVWENQCPSPLKKIMSLILESNS